MKWTHPAFWLALPLVTALLLGVSPGHADDDEAPDDPAPETACEEAVLAKVRCSNPEEVCKILLGSRERAAGWNVDQLYEFRKQDLGDGSETFVFAQPPGGDAYAYLANLHFAFRGDELELLFDGRGVPTRYATDRSRVNRRYQIERTSKADIPGLYRKVQIETWFWTGSEYALAYTRTTIEGAADRKLNGTETVWNPATEALYKNAGVSWTYRVQASDTLSAIAKRQGVSADELVRQNRIADPARLRLGQELHFDSWKINAR